MDNEERDDIEEEPVPAPEKEPAPLPETEAESENEAETEAEPVAFVDGLEHPVDPAAIRVRQALGLIVVLAAGGAPLFVLTLIWALGDAPSLLFRGLVAFWVALFAGFLGYAWQWPALQHRHLRYRVDARGVRIRRGVLWRKIISIPTSRVQHTDVTQGPLQRHFGLATLTVHTAGTQSASIALPGLAHDVALKLRDHLLPGDGHGA